MLAITLDPCFNGVETDYSPISKLCEELGIPYVLKRTEIGQIVFDVRNESNPCSLCARTVSYTHLPVHSQKEQKLCSNRLHRILVLVMNTWYVWANCTQQNSLK